MSNRLFLALACALVLLRLPSLAQPMGADPALYAYVGERILAGELPYRDAWDQKPPAIHYTYAALRAVWSDDGIVPAADLLVAVAIAALLYSGNSASSRGVAQASALVFLLLSNPSFQRLSGVRVRAQCETFIALAVTLALVLLVRSRDRGSGWKLFAAGVAFGTAFAFKYNAAAYVLVAIAALAMWKRLTVRALALLAAGFALVPAVLLAIFARGGALGDLYQATVAYNLRYSGETYGGPLDALRYLVTFPIHHARVDALWLVGGAGCAVLLASAFWKRDRLLPVMWVAAACLTIAVNGGRDLPQYFVQAAPALALAAAWGGSIVQTRWRAVNIVLLALVAYGAWRVNDFQKFADQTWFDTKYSIGRMSRADYLERYGDRALAKYSALANVELGEFLRSRTLPADRVFIFGFSCAAYVEAERASGSRFFWSRPVIAGFNEGVPGYGVSGVLADLERSRPAIVALQIRDWAPDVDDSARFFMATPSLAGWLQAGYTRISGPEGYELWQRQDLVE